MASSTKRVPQVDAPSVGQDQREGRLRESAAPDDFDANMASATELIKQGLYWRRPKPTDDPAIVNAWDKVFSRGRRIRIARAQNAYGQDASLEAGPASQQGPELSGRHLVGRWHPRRLVDRKHRLLGHSDRQPSPSRKASRAAGTRLPRSESTASAKTSIRMTCCRRGAAGSRRQRPALLLRLVRMVCARRVQLTAINLYDRDLPPSEPRATDVLLNSVNQQQHRRLHLPR